MDIGGDSIADICMPIVNSPRREKKVVMYGTSIMQGGCATRTGMAATNMIQRDLNCEVVNLGFSGEGKMDMCIARAMAQISDAYKDIYYVTCDGICGDDNEGTVDGIHFTDIGFRRYADKLIPVIKPLLER